jgi:hypothetical protein
MNRLKTMQLVEFVRWIETNLDRLAQERATARTAAEQATADLGFQIEAGNFTKLLHSTPRLDWRLLTKEADEQELRHRVANLSAICDLQQGILGDLQDRLAAVEKELARRQMPLPIRYPEPAVPQNAVA